MTARRRGLGRGLDALLGAEPERQPERSGILDIAIDQLAPNRFQPRVDFDASGLEDLAGSIRSQGLVQPIVVTPRGDGGYTIVAGERRWRAARMAGLERVPVVVREVADDRQLLELALVENLQRSDLNPIEEAEAFRTLGESFGLSQEEIAARVGKGRTTITNTLRLLRLPPEIQDFLRTGELTAGQARPLLALPDAERQLELAGRARRDGLTARELEKLATAPRPRSKKGGSVPDVHTRTAIDKLTQALQTKVDIVRRRRGGLVRIYFHSEEELIRLYDRLIEPRR